MPQIVDLIHGKTETAFGERRRGSPARSARCARQASCGNSSISEGASARLASMKCENCGKNSGSFSVLGDDIAEQSDLAIFQQQPAQHLHAAEQHQVVDLRHQAGGFGMARKSAGRMSVPCVGAQPGHRFVIAHLALRQRQDRLQIEIDAIGIDRFADDGDDLLAALPLNGPLVLTVPDVAALASASPALRSPRGSAAACGRSDRLGQRRRAADASVASLTHARRRSRPDSSPECRVRRFPTAADRHRVLTRRSRLPASASNAATLRRQFADLAGEIGGSARQIGDLVADIAAVAHARRNGIVDGEGRPERRQRHDRRLRRPKGRTADRPPRRGRPAIRATCRPR